MSVTTIGAPDRAVELMDQTEFQAIVSDESAGSQRFLIAADWCRDRDAERDCPELVLALKAMHERVVIGPKVYRAGTAELMGLTRYWVHGCMNGRSQYSMAQLSGYETVGTTFADVVRHFNKVLTAEATKLADRKAKSEAKAKLKAEWVNPFKVGDLLSNSWGYDQTNWEFVQVVAVGKRSVTVRAVTRTSEPAAHMSAYVFPVKDEFLTGYDGAPRMVRFTFSVYEGKLHASLPARHGSWHPVGDRERFLETSYA